MATFKTLPSGLIQVQIARHGIRRSKSFTGKTAAQHWAAEQEAQIMGGDRYRPPKGHTVAGIFRKYREEISPGKKGARWEQIRLEAWEATPFGRVRLALLDTPDCDRWQTERLKQVSSATVRRERNLINHAFEQAVKRWKWLQKNPFKGLDRPADGKARRRTATKAELARIMKDVSPAMRRAIIVAVETGMREGEIVRAQVNGTRVAHLPDTKNGEARDVPLSAAALQALQEGIPLRAACIGAKFREACARLGIEGLTFHDLRHTACTRIAHKLTLLELCTMMGWKDPRFALRYYNKTAQSIAERL